MKNSELYFEFIEHSFLVYLKDLEYSMYLEHSSFRALFSAHSVDLEYLAISV